MERPDGPVGRARAREPASRQARITIRKKRRNPNDGDDGAEEPIETAKWIRIGGGDVVPLRSSFAHLQHASIRIPS